MRLVPALFVAVGVGQATAVADMGGLKLDGLADAMKMPDLSALTGGAGKAKEGFKDILTYFVAPPSVNSTVTIMSTDNWSLDFSCQEAAGLTRGFYFIDVKPSDEDFAFLGTIDDMSNDLGTDCIDGLNLIPAGDGSTCLFTVDESTTLIGREVPSDSTDVSGIGIFGAGAKFSDGSQFVMLEDSATVVLTGNDGNSTLMDEFGIPSSCAAFGFIFVDVPKGLGFSAEGALTGKPSEKTDEGKGGLFPFKDGAGVSELFKLDGLELPSVGVLPGLGGGDKGGSGKGPFKGYLTYYLNSPEGVNSTITVLSTPYADIDYSCLERDGQVWVAYTVVLKGGKDGVTVLKKFNDQANPVPDFSIECDDVSDLLTLAPGETVTCELESRDEAGTTTTVDVSDADLEVNFLFSNGLFISTPDDDAYVARTGFEGNSNFTQFFGADICATFGPILVDIPKGMPYKLNSELPGGKKDFDFEKETEDEKDEDTPFKLDALSDSFKLDFDLSGGLFGSAKGGAAPQLKSQPLQYHVAPASLNSTANIFSTKTVSVDFACAEGDGTVFGIILMTVTAPKNKDLAFLVDSEEGTNDLFDIPPCEDLFSGQSENDDLKVISAGETVTCFLAEKSISSSDTTIDVEAVEEFGVQFSDGFQFTMGDDGLPVALTGANGNDDLSDFFGAPSSCLAWGYVNFVAPKGVKVDVLGKQSMSFP
uniref:Uncharacterized protein n=1 Tax=Chromera velia CCMP2878 TaxID=1169474 RepID=A0A0G4GXF4_9ALVE|mmetsp:Transcript_39413/g.77534  ORF Transcript_39413/g.77534 Transcript_39413/m.77534 type:complete len:704 (+) Transcript_39413:131-2242(+)|eukprot:Cvel_5373.t1-p1 / transcript=Cvel_5373.t1 / gene=Cvel_5373 / organism=Chromera_velia_CCMP2878 / gene_product=hypothetical protein / transcript_product=hypothetical protein / location=Cvel_scaffold249:76331-80793(-) / protein_length=703 / sequence_SO=supercontig / SO=protein_coding / is_pseudo=false